MNDWIQDNSFVVIVGLAVAAGVFLVAALVLAVLWRRARRGTGRDGSDRVTLERERLDLELELAEQGSRLTIVRELHELIVHSVSVIISQADGARYAAAADPQVAARTAATIADTARTTLGDLRRVMDVVRAGEAQAGPQPSLSSVRELFKVMRDAGLVIEFVETGTRLDLKQGTELAIYRILQEALTNALRHGARDEPTVVELEWGADAVDLVVTNAAPASAAAEHAESAEPPHPGHGIDGMRERATLAGGVLSVHEGETFRVRLRLPVEPSPEPAEPGEDARSADVSESPEVNA